jgi:UDP-N-acetylglucosamine transferase subunit ALG13
MGSIITAVTLKKKMIVVPRLRKYKEHVNDHQLHSAQKFEEIGVVQYADNKAQLLEKVIQITSFEPAERGEYIAPMISKISDFLNTVNSENNDS